MKAAALSGARRDARARFLATERRFIAVPLLEEGHEEAAAEREDEDGSAATGDDCDRSSP